MYIVYENQTDDVLEWCNPSYYTKAFNTHDEAYEHMLERVRLFVQECYENDLDHNGFEGKVDECVERYFEIDRTYGGGYACSEFGWMWRILEVPGRVE